MRKILNHVQFIAVFLLVFASAAGAMDVSVETIGEKDLKALKPGLEKTAYARCISRGIDVSQYEKLEITLVQIGQILSMDAVLDTTPPMAFHTEIESNDEISGALDEMIDIIFEEDTAQARPVFEKNLPDNIIDRIDLNFEATSVCTLNDEIFVSDEKKIYKIVDDEPEKWWRTSRTDDILRIYPYKDSIIALVRHNQKIFTFRITDGSTTKVWTNPVVPKGDGLLSAALRIKPDLRNRDPRWSSSNIADGTPDAVPNGADIINTIRHDILPTHDGAETITFDDHGRLSISSEDEVVWKSEHKMESLPFYIEEEYTRKGFTRDDTKFESKKLKKRYYLSPRIIVSPEGSIITIKNGQGSSTRMLSRVNMYNSSHVVSYSWEDEDLQQSDLARASIGYCIDIAQTDKELLVLKVSKKRSKLDRISY